MIGNRLRLTGWMALAGPGILVMLADTDAGSLVLSAQNGALWGYRLLLLQLILIPILFMAQELTLRLGLVTGKGLSELIKEHFGKTCAGISVSILVICCMGALLTELGGLAAVGELFNIPVWKTMAVVVGFLTFITWTGSYHSVERIAIFLGVFEIIFVGIAWQSHPDFTEMKQHFFDVPWKNTSYLYLAAGNIGAVIMPWMIFFQQSAVIDKGLTLQDLRTARIDTAIGAVITQFIICSVLIFTAATIGKTHPHTPLQSVTQISNALVPLIGEFNGRLLFALGMAGAAIVATIVVSLTAVWGVGEVLGFKHSLQDNPKKAPWFYGFYTLFLVLSGLLIVGNNHHLVFLSVTIEMMNTLLLPLILYFLFLLARAVLPEKYSLKGWYEKFVGSVFLFMSSFGLVAALCGLFLRW
jgi:Mn2+/Fe2+ NRAMP family transporter